MTTDDSLGYVGRYALRQELPRGRSARVFRADDPVLQRPVALKIADPPGGVTPAVREQFSQEARAAAIVRHPNIVTIYDIGEQQGWPYLVMELIEGGTLRDYLQRNGPLEPADAVELVQQLAHALAYAQGANLAPRGLGASHVLLRRQADGQLQPVLSDFGPPPTTDMAGAAAGEVRALAALFWEALSGQPLPASPPPAAAWPGPPALQDLLRQALTAEAPPFRSGDEFAQAAGSALKSAARPVNGQAPPRAATVFAPSVGPEAAANRATPVGGLVPVLAASPAPVPPARKPPRRRGWLRWVLWPLALLLLCACLAQSTVLSFTLNQDPRAPLLDYYTALRAGDYARAHDLLTRDYAARKSVEQLRKEESDWQTAFGPIRLNPDDNNRVFIPFGPQAFDGANRAIVSHSVLRARGGDQFPMVATLEREGINWRIANVAFARG